MEMLKHLVIEILVLVALTVLVHGQSQLGFISIDCGLSETSAYTDKQTSINYTSDASFIETGENNNIAPEYDSGTLEQQFRNLRSFPEGKRNCYTIKLARSNNKVLLRARFMYGNYDGQGKLPSFDLILGADLWDSVEFENESTPVTKEIIHVPQDSYIHVCLLNTGSGTPFISALELRPLRNSAYNNLQSGSLLLLNRWDVGSTTTQTVRYIDDIYDRIWVPYISQSQTAISTSLTINDTQDDFQPPSTVMQTAMIPANGSNSLELRVSSEPKSSYYITFYFAETEKLQANQKREQNIYISGRFFNGPLVPHSNTETRVLQSMISGELLISINKTENSTLPPILNALEIYRVKEFPQLLTDQQDVDAVMNIKSKYGVQRPNWQGDPCVPRDYMWRGLNCSYNDNNSLRIISLNLSSSGLIGEIPPYISSLTSIQILDLSNNSLRGSVLDFLSELQVLRVLNLSGNKLTGSILAGLLEKQKNGQLSLSVEGNPDLHTPVKYKENKKFIAAVVAAVVSVSVLSTALAILWSLKRKEVERKNQKKLLQEPGDNASNPTTYVPGKAHEKDQNMKHELKIFDFQTIAVATTDFSMTNVLGKGGFGSVYKGKLPDGQDIAIKRLSRSSAQGVEEFQNEANLIAKLQHTNLVRLLGYSLHGEERILVYEYMPNKSLDFFIFDSQRKNLLDWKKRLSIIEGIAQGLVYLHRYSRLRVIHRDLKASNILLDDQMNPKISDFGMARIFGMNESIANTNRIVGTYGYMCPEYAMNGIVSIKTDVYSFGVLVLEILSGKKNNSCYHSERPLNLVGYAWQLWNEGKGLKLKDPTLEESCSADELLRCIQVGLLCVQDQARDRPTMSDVVSMLTNETLLLSEPKQPAFYINDTSEVVDSGNKLENYSTNDVTISVMEAR